MERSGRASSRGCSLAWVTRSIKSTRDCLCSRICGRRSAPSPSESPRMPRSAPRQSVLGPAPAWQSACRLRQRKHCSPLSREIVAILIAPMRDFGSLAIERIGGNVSKCCACDSGQCHKKFFKNRDSGLCHTWSSGADSDFNRGVLPFARRMACRLDSFCQPWHLLGDVHACRLDARLWIGRPQPVGEFSFPALAELFTVHSRLIVFQPAVGQRFALLIPGQLMRSLSWNTSGPPKRPSALPVGGHRSRSRR